MFVSSRALRRAAGRPSRPARRRLAATTLCFCLPLAGLLAPATTSRASAAGPQSQDAAAQKAVDGRLASAVGMLKAGGDAEALELLAVVAAEEPDNAPAHFWHGVALGRAGREADAQHEFLLAAALSPGMGPAHRMAAVASLNLSDYPRAWDQVVIAARTGAAVDDIVAALQAVSEPPADWLDRIAAPRLYVEPADVTGVLATRSFVADSRPVGRDSTGVTPGIGIQTSEAVTNGDIPYNITSDSPGGGMTSGAELRDTGVQRLRANQDRIVEMMRQMRDTLAHRAGLGLASQPADADYRLRLEIHELAGLMAGRLVGCELLPGGVGGGPSGLGDADVDTDIYEAAHPKRMRGRLALFDRFGLEVYAMPLEMEDIASLADLNARIGRVLDELEGWIHTRAGE